MFPVSYENNFQKYPRGNPVEQTQHFYCFIERIGKEKSQQARHATKGDKTRKKKNYPDKYIRMIKPGWIRSHDGIKLFSLDEVLFEPPFCFFNNRKVGYPRWIVCDHAARLKNDL